jgi:hypothetical protein
MKMKALSIASILALAVAGTACSQASDQEAEKPATVAETETAAAPEVDMSGFNLGLPTEMETPAPIPAGEFNLDLGSAPAPTTDGFNLGTDLGASSGLESIPEIGTSIAEEPAEEEPLVPVDDEPVIRLD